MMSPRRFAIPCGHAVGGWIFVLFLCAPVFALASDLAIRNVHVFDSRDGFETGTQSIVVRNGTISEVLDNASAIPSSLKVVDGGGGYLLPGFIDAHVHILVPRCQTFSILPGGNIQFDRTLSEEVMSVLLDFGITSVRSPATPTIEGLALRDDLNAGRTKGPFALASAELINDGRMTANDLRSYVNDALQYKPDYFKVYAGLHPWQVKTVIEEAHKHGVPVIGHLGRTSWAEAIEHKIDFLTHAVSWSEKALKPEYREAYRETRLKVGAMRARLNWLEWLDLESDEVTSMIEALAASKVPVDPTLVAYDAKFSAPDDRRYRFNANVDVVPTLKSDWNECRGLAHNWTKDDFQKWRELFPKLQSLVRMMHERGVVLMTGSDTANEWVIPGESLHQEFELLVEAGIPPRDVLKMTGAVAANALGLEDRGVIEKGYKADFVLLTDNPEIDISSTRTIVWVMKDGEIVSGNARID